MRKFLSLAAFTLTGQILFAQNAISTAPKTGSNAVAPAPKGNARISGFVTDPETQKPIEFATVALLPPIGDKPLDGTICNEKGQFRLENVAAGNYRLVISF